MRKGSFLLVLMLLAAWPLAQEASGWEWQFALGPWTLEPWTSPIESEAEKMVSAEAGRLLAPILSEFTVFAFEPQVEMRSRGWFASVGCWRRLRNDRFALGLSASYLDFSLPFTLADERDISLQGIPIARISTSGQGQVDLRTFMLGAHGRWRILQSARIAVYIGLGLTLLSFSGDIYLPLTVSVESFLGTIELSKTEDERLAELRAENTDIPAWVLSPSLSVSIHHRLGDRSRLFIELSLSQGTFLAVGLSLGR
ncbi:MAG: hypothetical protein NTW95_08835 [Candidatus Aminicenantes bacterium]|nr:hypothetical protein [Candidatus Aminicenantes bacterium]